MEKLLLTWLIKWFCFMQLLPLSCLGVSCNEAFSCFNETIVESSPNSINMYGFMSSSFSSISANGSSVHPWGARSGQSLKLLETNSQYPQDARGYLSLAWSEYINHKHDGGSSNTASCFAEGSCHGIDTMVVAGSGVQINCQGARSCDDIGDIYNISGYFSSNGAFSTMNTRLHTIGGTAFDFHGYFAGYNTTIYCNDGNTCTLRCESNACVNLNFICNESVSTCNVYCDHSDYCANSWNGNTDNSDYDIYNSVSSLIDDGDSGGDNELLSLLTRTYDEHDWYENCIENSEYACINSSSDSNCYDTSIDDSEGTTITQPICCSAYKSCYSTNINVNNVNADIYCDASESCDFTDINLNYQSNIYIRARQSLRGSTISNFVKMVASSSDVSQYWESLDMFVSNGMYLNCFGYKSCYEMTIRNVSNIYAAGYVSLYNSIIYSNGSDMNIYLLGYKAGYGVTIYCNEGDKCNVFCLNNTNDECLSYITWAQSSNPTQSPTQAPVDNPTVAPSLAPSAVPTIAPSLAPTISPSAAPTDDYETYTLIMNISTKNESGYQEDRITFYVKLEGITEDSEWSPIEIDESRLKENEWIYVNYSIYWLNVGYSNSRLTMVTYDKNDILFDCFFIYLNENEKTFEQSVCQTDTVISVTEEEYDNGYCAYSTIDYLIETIKVKTSDENTGCPYDNSNDGDSSVSSSGAKSGYVEAITKAVNAVVGIVVVSGILIVILAKLWAKFIAKNVADEPPKATILKFFLHLADFWSDIGLTLVWYLNDEMFYFYISGTTLLLSTLASAYGAVTLTNKWKNYHDYSPDCPERLVNYSIQYQRMIYLLTIFSGLKPTIFLLRSKLFYHKMFNIPLKQDELDSLYKYQVIVVILETIPELILQIFYLIFNGIGNGTDVSILFISLVLSIMSILVELMVFFGNASDSAAHYRDRDHDRKGSSKYTKFGAQTIFGFEFSVKSTDLKKYHIMTNKKLEECLNVFFKDPNQAWQSAVNLCKFTLECYYVKDKLVTDEIEVYCQMVLSTSFNIIEEMERKLNDCVKDIFDEGTPNHRKLKQAICNKLKISTYVMDSTQVIRSKNISLRHENGDKTRKSSASTVRTISSFNVVSRSDHELSEGNDATTYGLEMEPTIN